MLVKSLFLHSLHLLYVGIVKPLFFRFEPETVHVHLVSLGESIGNQQYVYRFLTKILPTKNKALQQTVSGIEFENPIGLSAGFDYEGRLPQVLPAVGFGFETVGTITNLSYGGNPRPMLGRLPKSKSLMVNKGFKNLGAKATIERLETMKFCIPIGISIGRSNNPHCNTQSKSIQDILSTFIFFEKSLVKHSYYELNISCPNLFGNVTFYPPKNLRDLLVELDGLHIRKPIFVKMPIEKSNEDVIRMLEVIADFSPRGVIFGNLQKDRTNRYLDKKELEKFPRGNFSGKPTFERSNELIQLSHKMYKKRFIIIGCGGVFSGEDAYRKISLGSTLVQLITGMIFIGPQLITQINLDLLAYLKRDGFGNIKEAVGHAA